MNGCMSLDLICMTHQIIAATSSTCMGSGDRVPGEGVGPARQEVQRVSGGDKGEDRRVAGHHLRDDRGVEVADDLVEHQGDGLHGFGAEQ